VYFSTRQKSTPYGGDVFTRRRRSKEPINDIVRDSQKLKNAVQWDPERHKFLVMFHPPQRAHYKKNQKIVKLLLRKTKNADILIAG